MAPESSREKDTRHHALPKRRLSTHDQGPDDHESKRARIGDYSTQSQPTFSTNSAPSTSPFYVGQVEATTPFNENIDNASEGNKQWDLCDELIFNVRGEDETQEIYGIMVGEGWSSKIMGIHWGGTKFTSNDGSTVHFIIRPHPYSMNPPTRLFNLEEEAGCREFVEMIGGCWVE
ncbi:hypothetical protein NCS56_01216000 [Fusarium sp. Ph1]|nr:hypothetical protein NCS56_01216000 [Fusarium sp. Ph1]